MPATVTVGPGYRGLAAWRVVGHGPAERFVPGRTVLVCPRGEEAPAWRAILAGLDSDGAAYVVPLTQHFGELRVRKLTRGLEGLCLSIDEPRGDEVSWADAKTLALSIGYAFGLVGGDR